MVVYLYFSIKFPSEVSTLKCYNHGLIRLPIVASISKIGCIFCITFLTEFCPQKKYLNCHVMFIMILEFMYVFEFIFSEFTYNENQEKRKLLHANVNIIEFNDKDRKTSNGNICDEMIHNFHSIDLFIQTTCIYDRRSLGVY
mmetsp:Transcript_5997/g.9097  ORF Transcript_5997/g.9097 Transcript_5997/m.9097 type:complete len:142 (+) Transcript_5997:231-656(+)